MKTFCYSIINLIILLIICQVSSSQIFEKTSANLPSISPGSFTWTELDNDGILDLVANGSTETGDSIIFIKNTGSNFTQKLALENSGFSCSSFDLNSDGYQDITTGGSNLKLYENLKYWDFKNIRKFSIPTSNGALLFDFNYDCRPDLFFNGEIVGNILKHPDTYINPKNGGNLFKNYSIFDISTDKGGDGLIDMVYNYQDWWKADSTFLKINKGSSYALIKLSAGSLLKNSTIEVSDLDNDGKDDIILTGVSNSQPSLTILKNNGNFSFTYLNNHGLPAISKGDARCADFDNDGDQDIIIMGQIKNSYYHGGYYQNNGTGIFSLVQQIDGLIDGAISIGDYNNDDKLDFIINGSDSTGTKRSFLWKNTCNKANASPSAPKALYHEISGKKIKLSWSTTTDEETPSSGLTYNVGVWNYKDSSIVLTSSSLFNGIRQIVKPGNTFTSKNIYVQNLSDGKYFWRVQTIDGAFEASEFSLADTFTYVNTTPENQITDLQFKNIYSQSVLVRWNKSDGDSSIVFIKEGTGAPSSLINNHTYYPKSEFGKGDLLGDNFYCVFNGVKDSVLVTGLKDSTLYSVYVFSYNGLLGSEKYLNTITMSNSGEFTTRTSPFLKKSESKPFHVRQAIGDIDNDNKMEYFSYSYSLFSSNIPFSGIFKYYSDTVKLENNTTSILDYAYRARMIDLDNDGDLDISYSAANKKNSVKVLVNENGSLVDSFKYFPGNFTAHGWGDYDNDGDYDLISNSYLMENDGWNFNKIVSYKEDTLPMTFFYAAHWIDFDNDGDLDILGSSTVGSYVLTNHGDKTFTWDKKYYFYAGWGGYSALSDVGDINHDGYWDIISLGNILENSPELYMNQKDGTFKIKAFQSNIGDINSTNSNLYFTTGDINNDGNVDLHINEWGPFISQTDSTWKFSRETYIMGNSVDFGDIDGDQNLDLIQDAAYFKNMIKKINYSPEAPSKVSSYISGNSAVFLWNRGKDDITPTPSLTYNLGLYQKESISSNSLFRINPMSDTLTGFRRVPYYGNAQLDTFMLLRNLDPGKYSWKVQTIDGAYNGSTFINGNDFTINNTLPTQASNLIATVIEDNKLKLSWERGQGDSVVVFIKEATTALPYPENGASYIANSNFGKGSQIRNSGWHCVYKGTGDSVIVSGLYSNKEYRAMACEYNYSSGNLIYQNNYTFKNPLYLKGSVFPTSYYNVPKEDNSITIFPNPSSGIIYLKSKITTPYSVEVIDLNGKPLRYINNINDTEFIDLKDLKPGLYFLHIKTEKNVISRKLVIE